MRQEVSFLADSVGNRYPASAGDIAVRNHLLQHFDKCKLECHEQRFEIVEYVWGTGSLSLSTDDVEKAFTFGKDFDVAGRSAADTLSAKYVVVAGNLADSLLHLVRGKIVVCYQKAAASGYGRTTAISDIAKAGGLGVIYVNPPDVKVNHGKTKGNRSAQTHTIPILFLNHDQLNAFASREIIDTMDAGSLYTAPSSSVISIATQHFEKRIQAANVFGIKRGVKDKYVIVGAHYDTCAPDPETGEYRRGANDNASGVAMVMALAERLGQIETCLNIVFIAFGGEEKGALGSKHFVSNMPFNYEDVVEMINLDMVGRMDNETLYYAQYNGVQVNLAGLNTGRLHLSECEGGMSDHMGFVHLGIPVTYFNTGEDPAIHTTSDTPGRLNYGGMDQILGFLTSYITSICGPSDNQ